MRENSEYCTSDILDQYRCYRFVLQNFSLVTAVFYEQI